VLFSQAVLAAGLLDPWNCVVQSSSPCSWTALPMKLCCSVKQSL